MCFNLVSIHSNFLAIILLVFIALVVAVESIVVTLDLVALVVIETFVIVAVV